ncbi:GlxA family transcriptional regulator [Frondihabitans australicus]|uniref:Transcriptional regulator GlxA family with amidase domain n=1 Tax=Frondihabitans australicus TaxID=386892 RepID=A0A495IMC6_9MICO|nr:DJ-1/PfpI family protein [Frondihabitans australicus]RKR76316.1 transcriptional regulator GlxA family with amidase domain [Frondihabitans australicus]
MGRAGTVGGVSTHKKIALLVFNGVKMLDFTGPAEVFAESNMFGGDYELFYVSPAGDAVTTSIGIEVGAHLSAFTDDRFDTVVLPGSELAPPVFMTPAVLAAAESLIARSSRIASICSGAFIPASLGLLDGRRATTHWKFVDDLAKRYPAVDVEPDAIFVKDGNLYSSAGVAAGIDLALALVEEDFGADVARNSAQGLLVYMQRAGGQSQFSAPLTVPSPTSLVVRTAVDLIKEDPAGTHTIDNLARRVSVSPRHLTRLFREEMDITPAEYVAMLRLDIAKAMLDGGHSIAHTAEAAGYRNAESLRRAFLARLGISPSGYQRRFLSTQVGNQVSTEPEVATA